MSFQRINKIILIFTLLLLPIHSIGKKADPNKFKTHINSIEFLSRKSNNTKFYLDLSEKYCDSILISNGDTSWVNQYREKNLLTLNTCQDNINHKVQLFPFFKRFPYYMGFADDAIEYAYDSSLKELFETTYKKIYNGPLSRANITSIITKGDCDPEMFEIVKQTIISNTSHYIINETELFTLLDKEKAINLISSDGNISILNEICDSLNLDNLGIFHVNNIDVIDNKIYLVESRFQTFSSNEQKIEEYVLSRGFSYDKRGILPFNLLLLIIESILFISLISLLENIIINKLRSKNKFSVKDIFLSLIKNIKFVSCCIVVPALGSFMMIYLTSFIIPNGSDHYLEVNCIIWFISLTILMSIVPTFVNLFIINRLNIDGFHNLRGYKTFANTSIYGSFLPVFIFFICQYEFLPTTSHLLLVVFTYVLADLLARCYFKFTSKSIHLNQKHLAVFGLLLSIILMVFFNAIILNDLSVKSLVTAIIMLTPISIGYLFLVKYIDKNNTKKLASSKEKYLLNDLVYVGNVLNPRQLLFDKINSQIKDDALEIGIINASIGMGKTKVLQAAKKIFLENNWNWYYGDCDQIQDENSISFEPFIEAFRNLLGISQYSDRSKQADEFSGKALKSIIDLSGGNSDIINDLKVDDDKSMIELCVEISELIVKTKKKTIIVIEDLHWIDPESYSFLKLFIKTINRNEFVRKNTCLILTLRDDSFNNYRGLQYLKLHQDLTNLNKEVGQKFIVTDLINNNDFNLKDFTFYISEINPDFKIQRDSLEEVNYKFNTAISHEIESSYISPLYIIKVIEKWIQDKTLIYTPDGYTLNKSIEFVELPNSKELDAFYHNILDSLETKWVRILESAAIIGRKFDAGILSQVWKYELLEILNFLEKAESAGLITDLSHEDNIYEFNNKRIVSAIKSYFHTNHNNIDSKQIVIEYNKRYLKTQEDIFNFPNKYSIEEVLSVIRRAILLLNSDDIKTHTESLILNVTSRLLYDEEHEKLDSLVNLLNIDKLSDQNKIIDIINIVSNRSTSYDTFYAKFEYLYNLKTSSKSTSFKHHLRIQAIFIILNKLNNKGLKLPLDFTMEFYQNEFKDDLKSLESNIINNYSGKELLLYTELFIGIAPKAIDEIHFINTVKEKLVADSLDYLHICLIETKQHSKNTFINNTNLEEENKKLHEHCAETKDKQLISKSLNIRTRILSNYIDKKDEAIECYINYSDLLYDDGNKINKYWIDSTLYILGLWCGGVFAKKHPEKIGEALTIIEKHIYIRNEYNDFNDNIKSFVNAKIEFLQGTNNLNELKKLLDKYLSILVEKKLENTSSYRSYIRDLAGYHESIGEYKEAEELKLKRTSLFEEKYKTDKESYRKILSTCHTNLSSFYRFRLNNGEKALYHAEKSLSLKIPEVGQGYGVSVYQYAKALSFNGNHKEALKHYENAEKYFKGESSSQLKTKYIVELNHAICKTYCYGKEAKEDLVKALDQINTANEEIKAHFQNNQLKVRIQEAEQILLNLK
jgi:hypothetical protein